MIPPRNMMHAAATQIENDLEPGGWDQKPLVFVLYNGDEPNTIAAVEIPMPGHIIAEHGLPFVLRMLAASGLAPGSPAYDMFAKSAHPDFCGVGLASGQWLNDNLTEEEARLGTTRSLADIEGSKEVRTVYIADTSGRLTCAQRVRGQEPTVIDSDDPLLGMGGSLAETLRDLVLAIAQHCPPDTVDMTAIAAMIPTDEHLEILKQAFGSVDTIMGYEARS